MLDFDDIDNWAPKLGTALRPYIPDAIERKFVEAAPQYEDALDLLFELTDRNEVIDTVLVWLRSQEILGYHGSRLTDTEIDSVRENGLIPLKAETRRTRLLRALSPHPRWADMEAQLDIAIHACGQGNCAGHREGQVHLTLSKSGLINEFSHYLTHGSEFDQHVAHKLLGTEGKELLARDGKPRIIQIVVPGTAALDAAHPYIDIDDIRAKGDLPNLGDQFLKSWSYRLAYPSFQSRTLGVDCGMVFHKAVPASWVLGFNTL